MRPLVGVGMVGMGAVMIFGGITGRLAPMLAALFVPSSLTPRSDSGGGFWGSITDNLPHFVLPLVEGADVTTATPPVGAQGSTPAPAQGPSVNPFTVPGAKVYAA